MDATSETRLSQVHPTLAAKIRQLADNLQTQHGIAIRVTQGMRSWVDQLNLWLKGRDRQGNIVDPRAVVTNAKPGYSWHCFGLAVDVAPFVDGVPDWDIKHPVWQAIVSAGEALGLFSGSEFRTFPDWPHFQYTNGLPVTPDDIVRQCYKEGGMLAVWEYARLPIATGGDNAQAQSQSQQEKETSPNA